MRNHSDARIEEPIELHEEEALRPQNDRLGGAGSITEWLDHFTSATCTSTGLASVTVPPRERILGNWFKEGDLGFIYGTRGLGKTWLAMLLARACAEGGCVAHWKVLRPRRVLYVDGEMPLDGIRERDAALANSNVEGLFYLQHEVLFHSTGKVLNMTSPAVQAALLQFCLRNKIEILFLDNLSCLFTGVRENGADDWELVLPWLLDMRRNRIAVVFVAHAGRNGFMRGTSRREDAAFWMIELSESRDGTQPEGARFVTRFVKNRNSTGQDCPPLLWQIVKRKEKSHADILCEPQSALYALRQLVEQGLSSASEIAEAMQMSKGQVSKLAKQEIAQGWLGKVGRRYALCSNSQLSPRFQS